MALNIIFPQLLLPYDSVKLGRLITTIDHPHQAYHDPPCPQPPIADILLRDSYTGAVHKDSNKNFVSALTSLISTSFSKRAKTQVRITAKQFKTYTLHNSDNWFDDAMDIQATRVWTERVVRRGFNIYMVVGFHTIMEARISYGSVIESTVGGQVNIPVALTLPTVGAIAPFGNIIDPYVGARSEGEDSSQAYFIAPGEQICAFQYRKVQHRWLSSNSLDAIQLSKLPRWSSLERRRDEEKGEDDILEVQSVPLNKLEGKWIQEDLLEGEIISIREVEEAGS